MNGRIAVGSIVIAAIAAGVGLYYTQVYGFYRDIMPGTEEAMVVITRADGVEEPLAVRDFQGIDSDSSPIRYRACFTLDAPVPEGQWADYPAAEPLVAPSWFSCFDASAIGQALERGEAKAYTSQSHYRYGIDRVIAVMPDGRAFSWPQINECGREVYDGNAPPPGCPTPPPQ